MKQITLFLALFFGILNIHSQNLRSKTSLYKLEQTNVGIISVISSKNDALLNKYLINKEGYDNYSGGIALSSPNGQLKWIYIFIYIFVKVYYVMY